MLDMDTTTSSSNFPFDMQRSSQVVPQLQNESAIDDASNIHKLALSLANPSPVTQKSFDFQMGGQKLDPMADFYPPPSPRGLFSPNSTAAFNIFSMMTPTPMVQPQTSPFTFGNSVVTASPYLGGAQAPLTPQSTLVSAETQAGHHQTAQQAVQSSQQPQQSQLQTHQPAQSAQQSHVATPQQPSATRSARALKQEVHETPAAEDDNSDPEEEEEEQEGSYEDHVPSSDEDSDGSYKHKEQQPKRRKRKAAHSLGTNVRCFEDLTDEDIAFMDFKELTRLMNAAGLSRQAIAETKARRRRLKNRQSARLCSNKKRELCNELATDKQKLLDDLKSLQQAHAKLQRDHATLRQQYESLLTSSKRARAEY